MKRILLLAVPVLVLITACSKRTDETKSIKSETQVQEATSPVKNLDRSFAGFVFGDSKDECLKSIDSSKMELYKSESGYNTEILYFDVNDQLNGAKHTALRFKNNKLFNVYVFFKPKDEESSIKLYNTLKVKIAEKFGEMKKGDWPKDWFSGEKAEKNGIEAVIEKNHAKSTIMIYIAGTDITLSNGEINDTTYMREPLREGWR